MLKDVGIVTISDLILTIIFAAVLLENVTPVYNCSQELFGVGIGFVSYQAFFFLRNLLIILCSFWRKKPDVKAFTSRMLFSIFDWIGFSAFVIWSTVVISSQKTEDCRVSDPAIHSWWLSCAIILILYWVYMILVCCLWDILCPLITCLICIVCSRG